MKILKRVLVTLLILVGLLVIISFLLPSSFLVERSTVIKAPVEVVFEQVNTIKNWGAWDPWMEMDSTIVGSYEGPGSGPGAKRSWTSEKSGNGSMTIESSEANKSINMNLHIDDWGSDSKVTWAFEPGSEGIKTTWGMEGTLGKNPVMRYMGLMMDKWIGKDYERGLAHLKDICEKMPVTTPVDTATAPTETTVVPGDSSMSHGE